MKRFERFTSLLLTLMLILTSAMPAAAEEISSNAIQIHVQSASVYAGNTGIQGMGELLTSITIKDADGNLVTDHSDVELGKLYKFSMRFEETDESKQFVLNDQGQLVYTFPEGLNIQDKASFPVFSGSSRVGYYEIKNNQLIFTPYYTEDGKNFTSDKSKGWSFVDYFGNAWLNFDFEGEFSAEATDKKFEFGDGVDLTVTVKKPATPPKSEVEKTSKLSDDKHSIDYTITAKVTDANADTFTITDTIKSGTAIGALDQNSFTVVDKKTGLPVPASNYTVDFKSNSEGDYTGFELKFINGAPKDSEYEIKYTVGLNLNDLKGEYKNVTVGANGVKADTGNGSSESQTPGFNFEGEKNVGKDHVSSDNNAQTMKWKLTIGNGQSDIKDVTATDSWTPLPTGVDAIELAENTAFTIKLYSDFDKTCIETITVTKNDPDFSKYFTVTTDENGKETGFTFKTPASANGEVKRCTVEYVTKVTRDSEHTNNWLNVKNDASSGGDSDSGSGSLGPSNSGGAQDKNATLDEKTADITSDPDYIIYTVKATIPKEKRGKSLTFTDRLRWSQNTQNEWGNKSILNAPESMEVVAVGAKAGEITLKEGCLADGESEYKFLLVQSGSMDTFDVLFNVPAGSWYPQGDSKWQWPEDEDVELTITYKIPWKTLVASGANSSSLDDFDDGQLKDISFGYIDNVAQIDNSIKINDIDRTKSVRKEGALTDPANGIITYTIHINSGMNVPIDGTQPLIDHFDQRYLEYVPDSFQIQYKHALYNPAAENAAIIIGEPEVDNTTGTLTFDFNWISSAATKDNWSAINQGLYAIYGNDGFAGLQADADWYKKARVQGGKTFTPYFVITYKLKVKQDVVGRLNLENTASMEGYGSAKNYVDYSPRYVTKESAYNEQGQELNYTLKVNEAGRTINNGRPLTLKDVMSNATPDLTSIVVQEYITTTDEQGNVTGGYWQALSADDWSVDYAVNAQGASVMEFTLPDGKPLRVTYTAYPNSQANGSGSFQVTNKATLNGVITTTDEDNKFVTVDTGSGAGGGHHPIVFIQKVDADTGERLAGATFKLEMLRKDTTMNLWYWDEIGEATTSATGLLRFQSTQSKTFYSDRLFRFTEVAAPTGYIRNTAPYYFYIQNSKDVDALYADLVAGGITDVEKSAIHSEHGWYDTIRFTNAPGTQTVGFEFAKVSENDKPLSGAEFSLTEWANGAAVGTAQTAVSGADGMVRFDGLEMGKTYRLTETKAAPGYLHSGESWLVTVDADGNITVIRDDGSAQTPSTITLGGVDVYAFVNRGVPELPTTGGNGTLAYSAGGVALMALAAAMLGAQTRRRRRQEDD